MDIDTLSQFLNAVSGTSRHSVWLWIALLEFAFIIILLFSKKRDSKRSAIKRKVLADADIDFGNIINSSFNAEELYKELMVKCHPDRFAPDESKISIAEELTLNISKYRHDLKKLMELKEEAYNKLNIKSQ